MGRKASAVLLRLEPQSTKRVRAPLSGNKGSEGSSGGVDVSTYGYCKKRHLHDCWKKLGTCLRYGSTGHRTKECPHRYWDRYGWVLLV